MKVVTIMKDHGREINLKDTESTPLKILIGDIRGTGSMECKMEKESKFLMMDLIIMEDGRMERDMEKENLRIETGLFMKVNFNKVNYVEKRWLAIFLISMKESGRQELKLELEKVNGITKKRN